MTLPWGCYSGREITFATMHGKEQLAEPAFHEILGAAVTAPIGIDTDQFGTFAGDIPRTLSPRTAALAKAHLGMQLASTTLGLASEGSFSSGLWPVVENLELVVFIDGDLGLEIVETTLGMSLLPSGGPVHELAAALAFAKAVGFPHQGVILQHVTDGISVADKNHANFDELERAVERLLETSSSLAIMPDYRAHRAPSRAETIRSLCTRMAHRLAVTCPRCDTPGFGRVEVEHGVACALCGLATTAIAADVHGCGKCDHHQRVPRELTSVDPRWCDNCNP